MFMAMANTLTKQMLRARYYAWRVRRNPGNFRIKPQLLPAGVFLLPDAGAGKPAQRSKDRYLRDKEKR
jgi:hypothetical protein